MLLFHLLQDEDAIRGERLPPTGFQDLRDRHEQPGFDLFRLQDERTFMGTAEDPPPNPVRGVFKIMIKKRGEGNPGDAKFFRQLPGGGLLIGLIS